MVPGYYISDLGRATLLTAEAERAKRAEQKATEEAAEAKRLKERREDRADEERRYRTQNRISVIMPIVTFLLGLLVEHFCEIVSSVFSLIT